MVELQDPEVSPEDVFIPSSLILQAQDAHLKICVSTLCP